MNKPDKFVKKLEREVNGTVEKDDFRLLDSDDGPCLYCRHVLEGTFSVDDLTAAGMRDPDYPRVLIARRNGVSYSYDGEVHFDELPEGIFRMPVKVMVCKECGKLADLRTRIAVHVQRLAATWR